ncbi:unnamed protein product [Ilex paraguariensis]|uniref:Dof zinc finger protein n=1 Tax=Ilex paraguariensis TaxID=185542 RepID=A0ABC8TIP4_9AQUA
MDPSSAPHHHQEMSSQTVLESLLVCTKAQQEKKPKPPDQQALNCPRCDSTNTKFCYYNNYSLSQPRYFCKSCRRYWTKGGTLRNIPVGGGCRKNKRSSSSSKRSQDQPLPNNPNSSSNLPPFSYDCNDLSLAFSRLQKQASGHLRFDHDHDFSEMGNPKNTYFDSFLGNSSVNTSATTPGFFGAPRTGFFENPNGVPNLYYGNMGHGENGGVGLNFSEEMTMPYGEMKGATTTATTVTTVKQELWNGREGENRVLWGFPGQFGGDGNIGDLDSGRQSWNGLGSSWHGGLLNSPLM